MIVIRRSRCLRKGPAVRSAAIALGVLPMALVLGGCGGGGGRLALRSAHDPAVVLAGEFTTGVYAFDDLNNLDVLLVEGPEDRPTQAVHIHMHWRPLGGKTPVDQRATNATVRYLVFSGAAAGVYSGAGFLFPRVRPGGGVFTGELRSTALRLADASENFRDRLGLAEATGAFSARRDEIATLRLLRRVQTHLRERLGYPRFVGAPQIHVEGGHRPPQDES